MTAPPQTMKAFVIEKPGVGAVKDHPTPQIAPDEVLVKVEYAASNPTDFKHLDIEGAGLPGTVLGLDFCGTVVSAGAQVSSLKAGDRVASAVHGGKFSDKGSYAQYLKVAADMCWKVPESVPGDSAATFGTAYITAAQCLFHHQGNAFPPAKRPGNDWFLVQGGSSSVGLFAVQLAKLIGYKVIATSSPHSFDLVKSYGADAVVDYHDVAEAVAQIKQVTGEGSPARSTEIAERRANVKVERIILYTVFGYAFDFLPGIHLPHKPEDNAWFKDFVKHSNELMGKYGIKGNPTRVREGLQQVPANLSDLREGKVSGTKLVIKV
ncbi:hypothetical protein EHS25_007414 [Saitozyma podzolica]|uniref:Enoyl reductase (ER) domain-containing protein n=1 Tax=Saitozyma podzolica TaxID=1890683 RepID=A0A427YPP9_9TREE|nr:hypothetical protein EHS25_007414 [Saitozyma podzolica]